MPAKPQTIRDQVTRHPLATFVALAYAISWISWLLTWLLPMGTGNGFSIIGGAGPVLAAIIVSAILRPEPSGIPAEKRWRLFGMIGVCYLALLAFRRIWVATGLVTGEGRVATHVVYPQFWAFLVDALAAAAVAFVLSGVCSRWQGVRDLLHSLNPRLGRVRWYWFVIPVGVYPGMVTLGNAISARVGPPTPAPRATGEWYWLALDLILLFIAVLLGGGGLEEPGWRGLALPLLQKRHGPLRSSLILGVIWAFWHWPMFWFGYYGGGPLGVFLYVIGVVPISILFTAIFNRTGGSLLVVILLHTSINATPMFITPTALASSLWMLLIFCVTIWMWRSPQTFASSNQHYE